MLSTSWKSLVVSVQLCFGDVNYYLLKHPVAGSSVEEEIPFSLLVVSFFAL